MAGIADMIAMQMLLGQNRNAPGLRQNGQNMNANVLNPYGIDQTIMQQPSTVRPTSGAGGQQDKDIVKDLMMLMFI